MKKILSTIFMLMAFAAYGQDTTFYIDGVEITMDKKIYSLIQAKCGRQDKPMIPGWRVQLDFSDKKQDMVKIRDKFIKYHPEIESYLTFDSPYWYVRVGNFENRDEAERLIKEIWPHYKGLFSFKTMVFQKKDEEE
jgi:hypothetical protein